jgi:hypothetical protein
LRRRSENDEPGPCTGDRKRSPKPGPLSGSMSVKIFDREPTGGGPNFLCGLDPHS